MRTYDDRARTGGFRRMATGVGVGLVVACAGLPASAAKLPEHDRKPQAESHQQEAESRDIRMLLLVERAPLASFLPDDKDAGVRKALGMLPDRIAELTREMGNGAMQHVDVGTLKSMFGDSQRSVRLAVFDAGFDPESGRPGIGVWASISAEGRADAEALSERMRGLAAKAPGPVKPQDAAGGEGHWQVDLPVGPLEVGPSKLAGGEWGMTVRFGARAGAEELAEAAAIAPAGVDPCVQVRVDLAGLAPLTGMLGMLASAADPQGALMFQQCVDLGLIGPQAISIEGMFGYDDTNAIKRMTVGGLKPFATNWGLSHRSLTDLDLAAIPSDATVACMSKFDWSSMWRWIESSNQMNEQFPAQVAHFEEALGVAPIDLVTALGGTTGFYMSDSTGGGSALSGVAMVSVHDRDTIWTVIESIAGHVNRELEKDMKDARYASIELASHQGSQFATFDVRGVPIPVRPSIALTDDWMLIGATPQAVKAAWLQVRGEGDNGLASNPRFARARFHGDRGLMAVEWIDSPRVMRDGYMVATLAGNALRNAVRSPHGADRDPGMVTPIFAELREGAKPIILQAFWEDEDLVVEVHADRSLLVNMSGVIGAFVSTAALVEPLVIVGLAEAAAGGKPAAHAHDEADAHHHEEEHSHHHEHAPEGDKPPF